MEPEPGPLITQKARVESVPLRPRPTQEAETRTQEEGEDEGGSDDNFAEEVVEQIGAPHAQCSGCPDKALTLTYSDLAEGVRGHREESG